MSRARSLNGGETKPLTESGWAALASLQSGPTPKVHLNPGTVDRLTREPNPLARRVELPSPFAKDKGGLCPHIEITDHGRRAERCRKHADQLAASTGQESFLATLRKRLGRWVPDRTE